MSQSKMIILIDRTHSRKHPWWRMALSLVLVVSLLFLPGVFVRSAAMQWAGFIAFNVIFLLGIIKSSGARLTIDEARKRLDELEDRKSS